VKNEYYNLLYHKIIAEPIPCIFLIVITFIFVFTSNKFLAKAQKRELN